MSDKLKKSATQLTAISSMIDFLEEWINVCREDQEPYDGASDAAGPPTTPEQTAECLWEHALGHTDGDEASWTDEFCPFCALTEIAEGAKREREAEEAELERETDAEADELQ